MTKIFGYQFNQVLTGKGFYVFDNCLPDINVPLNVIRDLNHNGQFNYDQSNVPGRLSANNIPYFSWLHFEIHNKMMHLIPNTKPSYNFLMQYLPGSEMYAHTDRPQCKWNFAFQIHGQSEFYIQTGDKLPMSITIDSETDFEDNRPCNGKTNKIVLKPNMGVLYSGTNNRHWLPPEPFYRAACVFHFVDKNFNGCLN